MPAFSHCFLKRFMAFSNDSPSLTRTPGILRITTFRSQGTPAKTRQYKRMPVSVKPTCTPNAAHLQQAKPRILSLWGSEGNERSAAVGGAARVRDGARLQPARGAAHGGAAGRAHRARLHAARSRNHPGTLAALAVRAPSGRLHAGRDRPVHAAGAIPR